MHEYRKLDFSKLTFSDEIISCDDALANVPSFQLSENIISGEKKIKVTTAKKEYGTKCVKLEISC